MPSRFWRDAASLILVSPPVGKVPKTGVNYEILTGIRSTKSSFMPKALVYPGGRIAQESDLNPSWMKTLTSFSKEDPNSVIIDPLKTDRPFLISTVESPNHIPRDIGFRLTALRETFEESGIFLSTSSHAQPLDSSQLREWRDKVKNDPGMFLKMCHEFEVAPDIWALHEWSGWLTPLGIPANPRRFDTIFYMAFTDQKIHPHAGGDNMEIFNLRWMDPLTILQSRREEDYYLGPPQVWETARFLNFHTLEALKDFCIKRSRKGCVSTLPVLAVLPKGQGVMSFLPGDDYYPESVNPEQSEEGFKVDHVDEEYKEVMKYTRSRNRIYLGLDGKYTIPFSNFEDPHGHKCPVEFEDLMIKL